MGQFTPRMEGFVRQQLQQNTEPWKIADQLARLANVDPESARAFVQEVSGRVRPEAARGHRTHFVGGLILMAAGAATSIGFWNRGLIVKAALLLIGLGFVQAWWGWARWRRSSK